MRVRLFTLVWGAPYIRWFEHALLRSLLWPENHAAVLAHADEINIYTRDQDREHLDNIASRLNIPIQFHSFSMRNSPGETLQPCLLDHLRNCEMTGHAAFIAPPDTIFGEGSVAALCAIGRRPGVCVAVPHVRINAGALDQMPEGPMTNPALVDFSWQHLHRTWSDANADMPHTNSRLGGVSWFEIRAGLYAVTHRLPTAYLLNVNKSDVEWFAQQFETGTFDHTFPVKLVKEQRQRFIGSSDAAFIAELTQEHENIPAMEPTDPNEPDAFWRDLEHNYVNRNTMAIFRGKES